MLDHIGLRTAAFEKSKKFFVAALAPLGLLPKVEYAGGVGFAKHGSPTFWLAESPLAPSSVHLAFTAPNRAAVDSFYEAAIAAGGRDNGKPGLRIDYHPSYYAAYVIDEDGNNIEAVCHDA